MNKYFMSDTLKLLGLDHSALLKLCPFKCFNENDKWFLENKIVELLMIVAFGELISNIAPMCNISFQTVWPDWAIFMVLGNKISCNCGQNILWLFGLFKKHHF